MTARITDALDHLWKALEASHIPQEAVKIVVRDEMQFSLLSQVIEAENAPYLMPSQSNVPAKFSRFRQLKFRDKLIIEIAR